MTGHAELAAHESGFEIRGACIVCTASVRGTNLSTEWAAARIRRAMPTFGATFDTNSNSRICFTKHGNRYDLTGVVTVSETQDGIRVTAESDVSVILIRSAAVLMPLALLYPFARLDGRWCALGGGAWVLGVVLRCAWIAVMLRTFARAGTARDRAT